MMKTETEAQTIGATLHDQASPLDGDLHWSPAQQRSACLVRVAMQQIDIDHVIDNVNRHPKSPLRKINLRQLLLSQRTMIASSRRQLALASELLGNNADLEKKTIGWLIDGRSDGQRLAAWRDARHPRKVGEGFPMRGSI